MTHLLSSRPLRLPGSIGAYYPAKMWLSWTLPEATDILKRLLDFGVNTIFSDSDQYRDDIIELAHSLDLRFIGGISCFHQPEAFMHEHPELWPILENGQRRPKMNWYIGVTPTNTVYNQSRLDTIERSIRSHELDGFCLDFIRWPLHWEQELRISRPLQSGFDEHTISRFLDYAGLEKPSARRRISELAAWILGEHRAIWRDFRCHIITHFVAQVRERIMAHRGDKTCLGVYLVPARESRRAELVGQRVSELSDHVDFFAPMVYHTALGRPADWPAATARTIQTQTTKTVLPVLQVDTFDERPMPTSEWQRIVLDVLKQPGAPGLIAFRGDMLFRDNRGAILRDALR